MKVREGWWWSKGTNFQPQSKLESLNVNDVDLVKNKVLYTCAWKQICYTCHRNRELNWWSTSLIVSSKVWLARYHTVKLKNIQPYLFSPYVSLLCSLILYVCVKERERVCVYKCTRAIAHVWRSEDRAFRSWLFPVTLCRAMWVSNLASWLVHKSLYTLSHINSTNIYSFYLSIILQLKKHFR